MRSFGAGRALKYDRITCTEIARCLWSTFGDQRSKPHRRDGSLVIPTETPLKDDIRWPCSPNYDRLKYSPQVREPCGGYPRQYRRLPWSRDSCPFCLRTQLSRIGPLLHAHPGQTTVGAADTPSSQQTVTIVQLGPRRWIHREVAICVLIWISQRTAQ